MAEIRNAGLCDSQAKTVFQISDLFRYSDFGLRPAAGLLARVSLVLFLASFSSFAAGVVTNCSEQSFRAALQGGGPVIFFEDCSIILTAPVAITNDTSIDARLHTVAISGGNSTRIFNVASNVQFTLIGLTVQNGASTNGAALDIKPGAVVVVTNCILSGNTAAGFNGVSGDDGADDTIGHNGSNGTSADTGLGGAIYNLGSLSIFNSTITNNAAFGGSGGDGGNGGGGGRGGNGGKAGNGAPAFGGGIYNAGTLLLRDCSVTGNIAWGGDGGFGGAGGAGTVEGLAGDGGRGADGFGGGLYTVQNIGVTILNCTFSDNTARGGNSFDGGNDGNGIGHSGIDGAAAYGGGIWSGGSLIATNCTFFRNNATGGNGGFGGSGGRGGNGGDGGNATGGGLYSTGLAQVVNCTFSHGSATGGTNGIGGAGPVIGLDGSMGKSRGGNIANGAAAIAFTLKNSLVGTNISGGAADGPFTDNGNNISADNSISFTKATSMKNTNPSTGALEDNGGPTKTMSLLTNSPALDAGDDLAAPKTDQRGIARTNAAGARSDIGAFEYSLDYLAPSILVQPTNQTVAVGGVANFSVSATGSSPLSYQWSFNGTNIVGETNATLTLPDAQLTNAGNYVVTVTNFVAARESLQAVLEVFTPLLLSNPIFQTTNFTFTFNTKTGLTYVVEYKNFLQAAAWISLATNAGSGNSITNSSLNSTSRFFRVREISPMAPTP